ncbi:uncharacterized protein LOC141924142 isoform X2 [Strix aluco]|uniref:uncharacterized protein LOC141924142 isoform X2 n=1 Tax=Strix aluco TaxID=111821 RepID=UPI003DA2180A
MKKRKKGENQFYTFYLKKAGFSDTELFLCLFPVHRQRSRAQEMQVSTLPSIHLLVNILGLSGSPVTLTAQTIEALVQCQAKSIPHHCSQSPRHGEVHRRALAEQQVQEQLEPKVPEPEDGRAHADVQTELCSDEPGDHGIKVEMVCQADVHLEQPPCVLCSLAEGGGAMARQAEGREEPCEGRQTPPLQAQEEPSAKTAAWACTEQVLAELFDSSLHIVCESNSSNDPTERGSEDNFSSSRSKGSVLVPGVHASASGSTRSSFSHKWLMYLLSKDLDLQRVGWCDRHSPGTDSR